MNGSGSAGLRLSIAQARAGDGHGRGEANGCVARVAAVIDEVPALLAQDRDETWLSARVG